MKRVVVTGMGCVTPIGNTVDEYAKALIEGKNGIDTITHFDVTDNKYTLAGELKDFDPAKRLDKNAIRKSDIYTQYALYAADEAVEQSGIIGKIDPDELGVYVGSGIGGFETFCTEHENLLKSGQRRVSPQFIPKMIGNIAAGNVAIRFGAKGPCIAHTTACATSSTSIGEAYRAIAVGAAEAIICGGSEAVINPLAVAGFGNCQALSAATDKNAASLPFDKRRGGFVMGEGAAMLVLEEYEHAVNRGAEILAEVVGYGTTCDAHHVTAPDPTASQVARAIKLAMKGNEVDAEKIYFNAHGTGTKLNDLTETTALKLAFGDDAGKIHVSSTKSMTGHMLGAAGAAEAIASILTIRSGIIPPTINLLEPDEECDLNYTPNTAVEAPIELALSESLGFGGHNVCLAFRACK
ncbi:MAG: beta-ketoacyl-ACP synthase II [Clostridiales bacterium]|nr:beta-ketoacyl-ACP synthase II [Clostridiales bacterium]